MLQARQKTLREEAAQLSAELGRLPVPGYSSQGTAQEKAREHLGRAIESMKQFEERLADARYESAASSEAAGDMAKPAEAAAKRLNEAGRAIRQGLSGKGRKTAADQAREMAELLADDAEAYDESLSEAQKKEMLARLAAAERLLESMAPAQWTTVSSGGGTASVHVYTKDGHATPAQTARLLARQFWSVALEARKREGRPVDEEPSDAEFFEAENEFFEKAARFKQRVEK